MKASDITPGMFVSVPIPGEPVILFIVSDEYEIEAFKTVDVNRMTPGFLSYHAVTKDVKEFTGDISEVKKKVIEASFNKPVGK